MKQTYKEQREEVKAEQKGLSYKDIKALMQSRNDFITELDHLPKQTHNWVDRGAKLTCENGGHPYHEVWKRV